MSVPLLRSTADVPAQGSVLRNVAQADAGLPHSASGFVTMSSDEDEGSTLSEKKSCSVWLHRSTSLQPVTGWSTHTWQQ